MVTHDASAASIADRVVFLRDGKVYEGKWVRADRHAPFRFVDAQGRDIPLKPGNSWWQVAPLDLKVTVTP